jgi:salicylate 1-O-methyltransferase
MSFQQQAFKDYNKASGIYLKMNLQILPSVIKYLLEAEPSSTSTLNLVDYGSSEGYNSMILYSKALPFLRARSSKPVLIFHNDLPQNNWCTLFRTINESPDSYLNCENVFYSAIGRSYLNQLCPSNSVHFGYAGITFHFLSKQPECDRVEHRQAYPEAISQMMEDLALTLKHRLRELVVGGIICIYAISREDENRIMYDEIVYAGVRRVYEKGLISEKEFNGFRFSYCGLKREEWERVLTEFEGKFEVLEMKNSKVMFPAYEQFLEDGDREEYFKTFRARYETNLSVVIHELTLNKSKEETAAIVEEAMNGIMERVPEPIGWESDFIFVALKKTQD